MGKEEAPGQNKQYTIIVNAEEKIVSDHKISYLQVAQLAFPTQSGPDTIYSVTYRKGEGKRPEGTMVDGDVVPVKDGMIFNVTATTKS